MLRPLIRLIAAIVLLTLSSFGLGTVAGAVDSYGDATIVTGLSEPVAMDFLPDGRALVADRAGGVLIGDLTVASPSLTTYFTIASVDTFGERGLLDILVDPLSPQSQVFVYYQHAPTQRSRIARIPITGNGAADVANETVIWTSPATYSSTIHYGGSLNIGTDGSLYLTSVTTTRVPIRPT